MPSSATCRPSKTTLFLVCGLRASRSSKSKWQTLMATNAASHRLIYSETYSTVTRINNRNTKRARRNVYSHSSRFASSPPAPHLRTQLRLLHHRQRDPTSSAEARHLALPQTSSSFLVSQEPFRLSLKSPNAGLLAHVVVAVAFVS